MANVSQVGIVSISICKLCTTWLSYRLSDLAIHSYHIYKDIWLSPVVEEQLQCEWNVGNSHDLMSVTVKKQIDGENAIIGCVPRQISPLCSV